MSSLNAGYAGFLPVCALAVFLSLVFTHLDIYLTFIPDIDPHWVSNDVVTLVVVVAYQAKGWHHIHRYRQDVSDCKADPQRAFSNQDPAAENLWERCVERPYSLNRSKNGSFQTGLTMKYINPCVGGLMLL